MVAEVGFFRLPMRQCIARFIRSLFFVTQFLTILSQTFDIHPNISSVVWLQKQFKNYCFFSHLLHIFTQNFAFEEMPYFKSCKNMYFLRSTHEYARIAQLVVPWLARSKLKPCLRLGVYLKRVR